MSLVDDLKEKVTESVWYLDSRCSNHMCRNEEFFFNLKKEYSHTIKLGSDSSLKVSRKVL